nr:hypothetical protein [uncultured Oribacterium sp.]
MNTIEEYLKIELAGFYQDKINGGYRLKGLGYAKDRTREEKAMEQAELAPTSFSDVYAYINEFLDLIRLTNGFDKKRIELDTIHLGNKEHQLGNKEHLIIDNGIIIRNELYWEPPRWNHQKGTYDSYDSKYDAIKAKFDLERVSDLLWFKFTDTRHLAVVAKSCDINWDYGRTCGQLVDYVGKKFDNSFIFVFPLTKEMIRTKADPHSKYRKYTTGDLECAVGNYLIEKGVPIIDYYSHMS